MRCLSHPLFVCIIQPCGYPYYTVEVDITYIMYVHILFIHIYIHTYIATCILMLKFNLTDYFLLLLLNSGEQIILMMTTNAITKHAPYPIMNNVIFLVGYSPYSSSLTITAIQRRRPQAQHRTTVQQYTNLRVITIVYSIC